MRNVLLSALLRLDKRDDAGHLTADVLSTFTENALRPEERNLVLEHLACCAVCRECASAISGPSRSSRKIASWPIACAIAAALSLVIFLPHFRRHEPALPKVQTPPERVEIVWRFSDIKGNRSLQRSSNGGKTWSPVEIDKNLNVQSLAWNGAATWARGENGQILESQDSGSHWRAVNLSPHQQLADVAVKTADPNESGTLNVITAKGDHWTRVDGSWHHKPQ